MTAHHVAQQKKKGSVDANEPRTIVYHLHDLKQPQQVLRKARKEKPVGLHVSVDVAFSTVGCVGLGNPDLDFKICISDFATACKIRKWISPPEIRPQGGFKLTNPNQDFMDFLCTVQLGNPKKDLQKYSLEQWSFCILCGHMQDRCFQGQFFKPFFQISQWNGKNENPKTHISALKSVFGFCIGLQI